MRKLLILSFVLFFQSFLSEYCFAQENPSYLIKNYIRTDIASKDTTEPVFKHSGNPTIPLSISIASIIYFFNPIVLYENNKIALGVTKEISLGFGYFGEHRFAFEYSFIFREFEKSHFRLGYKYDLLLNKKLFPSHMLQASTVISFGISYFKSTIHDGVSPEISFGYSFRNDKLLIYPHIKTRYTFLPSEGKSNILDFSTGILVGFSNPFIDLKIRNRHNK